MTPANTPPGPPARREIVAWALFDFANSSYTTVIVTVAFSVYFTTLVAPTVRADWWWGVGILVSNLLVVASAPVVGAVADETGRKKAFLFVTYVVCVGATAALAAVGPGAVGLGLALFVVSNVAYSSGENLSGAFLPEISTPATIGRISGFGWGLGYFGGLVALLLIRPFIQRGFTLANLPRLRWAWVATAAFFAVSALPTFLFLRERAPRGATTDPRELVRRGFSRLAATARSVGRFSELARFLGVFFVYSCGLTTVIAFAGIFAARSLGMSGDQLLLLFLLLQVSSALGAFAFGALQDRLGARRTIQTTLVLWIVVALATAACRSQELFWAIALVAGLGVGSLQSASRALVGLFSPVAKSGEFFAFWGLAGKAAYALGPWIFGLVSSASGSQRTAILVTAGFFVAGWVAMFRIDEERGRRAAAAWSAASIAQP